MIRTMHRIMIAAAALTACASADAADRRFSVTDFDRVQVDGPFIVSVMTGKSPSATVSGSPEALERISIEVQGRVLRIRANRSGWGGFPGAATVPATVTLSTHDLRAVQLNGSGNVAVDQAEAGRFDISLSGSGRVAVADLETDNLVIGLTGSGTVEVGGTAKNVKATVQGSGTLNAQGLTADDAVINSATSGVVDLAVRRTADVTSAGSGETIISGKAACTVDQIGSGAILCAKYADRRP